MKRILLLITSLLFVQISSAQEFIFPMDQSRFSGLSGNYGELRGNHFHCGLDLKTGGRTGAKVYAAANGYISKISVGAYGFGNAVTINHPSGCQTVYGHLASFAPKLQKLLRERQYKTSIWEQDILFSPKQYPVKAGDLIAYSGNSGSSGGPHLHFEVRNREGEPVNLAYTDNFKDIIKDTQKPLINKVLFFGFANVMGTPYSYLIEGPRVTRTKGKYVTQTMQLPKFSYVAVDAWDRMEGTYAKLAVCRYEVWLDETPIFIFDEGKTIPYSSGRYIKSLLEYSQKFYLGKNLIKSYFEPGNAPSEKVKHANSGVIALNDDDFHNVRIIVTDAYGNSAEKAYVVKRNVNLYAGKVPVNMKGKFMGWVSENSYSTNGFKIKIPMGSLYSSIYFSADTARFRNTKYSPLWHIGTPITAFHIPASVEMKASVPEELASKVVLANLTRSGRLISVGGSYDKKTGTISGAISAFGDYCVAADTVAPSVTFAFNNLARLYTTATVRIRDNLSGIRSFRVEIDGHWVVADYDGKTSRLIVPLADAKIEKGKVHSAVVTVTDMVSNKRISTRKFRW